MRRGGRHILFYPGIFAAVIGLTFIPLYVYPKLHQKEIRSSQIANRGHLMDTIHENQPGNMKQWSDPFKSEDNKLIDRK